MKISSIEASRQKIRISISHHVYNKTRSIQECLLSLKHRNSYCFLVCIAVFTAFPSRRASRNCSEGLEEMFLDRVAITSAIVDFSIFFSRGRLARSKLFCNDRAINWACAGKNVVYIKLHLWGLIGQYAIDSSLITPNMRFPS